jgi:hypothetical protein
MAETTPPDPEDPKEILHKLAAVGNSLAVARRLISAVCSALHDPNDADADILRRLFDGIDDENDVRSVMLALSAEAVGLAHELCGDDAEAVLAMRAMDQFDLNKANRNELEP